MKTRRGRYAVGSVVCDRRGYIKVKVGDMAGTKKPWIPEAHLVAMAKKLKRPEVKDIGKPIASDERVFHIGLNKSDNSPSNLVVIKVRLEKYALLPSSKVLFEPVGRVTIADMLKARGIK